MPDYLVLEDGVSKILLEGDTGALILLFNSERSAMDSLILFPPGASSLASSGASAIQIGSWLEAQTGIDFGARGLIQTIESSNALRDGGMYGGRYSSIRKMAIPLIIHSPSVAMWEGTLARAAQPGAMVALQPELVPSAQAVYFDVLDGRWEPNYDVFQNRAGIRRGTLFLDTQPWGYWPTEILLASAASIGQFGQISVNGASIIGDVPPFAHLILAPTTASAYSNAAGGSGYAPDMAAFSFAGRPSFTPFANPSYTGTGLLSSVTPSITTDKYAPGGVARILSWGGVTSWQMIADTGTWIASAIEPAYRGRFRVFAFARFLASYAGVTPMQMIVDADRYVPTAGAVAGMFPQPMASANQLATVAQVAVTAASNFLSASPGYQVLDMGEITLPPSGSGYQGPVRLRVWARFSAPSVNATTSFSYGGLYLLPAEGAVGVQARGMYVPTLFGGGVGALEINNGFAGRVDLNDSIGGVATGQMTYDGIANYRGALPRLGASTTTLSILTADRAVGNYADIGGTYITAAANVEYSQVSVSYRPQFQFLYGI